MLLKFPSYVWMKNFFFTAILFFVTICSFGQNLIGYNYNGIKKYMKENRQDMNSEKVINSAYSYIKYSDSGNSQTLLFFLNHDSICTSIRSVCDYSIKGEKVKAFDATYKKIDTNKWIDKRDGKDYLVEIRDEKWSFIILIEPSK